MQLLPEEITALDNVMHELHKFKDSTLSLTLYLDSQFITVTQASNQTYLGMSLVILHVGTSTPRAEAIGYTGITTREDINYKAILATSSNSTISSSHVSQYPFHNQEFTAMDAVINEIHNNGDSPVLLKLYVLPKNTFLVPGATGTYRGIPFEIYHHTGSAGGATCIGIDFAAATKFLYTAPTSTKPHVVVSKLVPSKGYIAGAVQATSIKPKHISDLGNHEFDALNEAYSTYIMLYGAEPDTLYVYNKDPVSYELGKLYSTGIKVLEYGPGALEDPECVYAHRQGSTGHIRVPIKYPKDGNQPALEKSECTYHDYVTYTGLHETFEYCKLCDKKRPQ